MNKIHMCGRPLKMATGDSLPESETVFHVNLYKYMHILDVCQLAGKGIDFIMCLWSPHRYSGSEP